MKRSASLVAALWALVGVWTAVATETVEYGSHADFGARPGASVEDSLAQLSKLDQAHVVRELNHAPVSLALAKRLIAHAGLKMEAAPLAEAIRARAARWAGPAGGGRQFFQVERVVVLDKALVREGRIPEELRAAVQYRTRDDVLVTKHSPARWIVVRDSGDRTDDAGARWTQALREHECITVDEMERKQADEVFLLFLELAEHDLTAGDPPLGPTDTAAGRIGIAWAGLMLVSGKFNAGRTLSAWMSPGADGKIPRLLEDAGGAEALTQRFASWSRERDEAAKLLGHFVLKQ